MRRYKLRVYIQDYTRSKWVDAGFRLAAGTDDPLVLDDALGERHSQGRRHLLQERKNPDQEALPEISD